MKNPFEGDILRASLGFVVVAQQVQSVEAGGTVLVPKIERCTSSPHVAPDYWCGEFERRVA